jgi:CheY-like chemotaxis protein
VKTSGESLLRIINDILDFSKIEANRLDLEPIDFDLRESLPRTVRTMAHRAHEKGVELHCEIRPDVPEALIGDPARLWQVIINLIGNAVKFTCKGKIAVLVETEELSPEHVILHFTVSDTGIGIPANRLQAVFEPFVQADNSTTRKYGGTGLGLTITARLVEMMRGRIWVESEQGKGTQFHFTARFGRRTTVLSQQLPATHRPNSNHLRVLVIDDDETNRRIQPFPTKATESEVRRLRILVVEDNPINQLLAVRVLQKAGHTVAVADNGQEALLAIARETFDVVLMDVQMPVMDGFQATTKIRQQEWGTDRHLPIVAMTAHALTGDGERCRASGMDGYVSKPFITSELFSAIANATTKKTSLITSDTVRIVAPCPPVTAIEESPAISTPV